MNALQDIGGTIRNLEVIRRLHRQQTWDALADSYTPLKRDLIAISARTPNLTEAQKTEILAAIQQLTNIEKAVETKIAGGSPPEVDLINTVVSEQIDRLNSILVQIQIDIERPRH
jgi:hypothetical protein